MTKLEKTDNPEKLLIDFINRMNTIQEAAKGFEGKPEVFMAYSLQVQIEAEKTRLSVELSKLKILESISKELWEIKYTLKGERIR